MNQLKITIAEPCHENWEGMENRSNGRHCSSCEKTVVDFTGQDRQQIESYLFAHSHEKVCGRFDKTSLSGSTGIQSSAITPVPPVRVGWFRSRWMALVAAVSFLGFGKKASAGVTVTGPDEPNGKETKNLKAKKTQTVVHGWIRNSRDQKGIARADVRIYSGETQIACSKSFANGSYFITIPENTIWDFKITLEYNAVDFQSQVLRDIYVVKDRVKLDIVMAGVEGLAEKDFTVFEEVNIVMGALEMEVEGVVPPEEVVMGGVSYERVIYAIPALTSPVPGVWMEDSTETVQPKAELNIKTYPNPSTGIFNVQLENSENTTLMVYDLQGGLVLSKKASSPLEIIDLTDRPNGTYIVLAIDEQTGIKKQNKVIKMQ